MTPLKTTADVAAYFGCKPRKVWQLAQELGLGVQLGGRAGWRFSEADVEAMAEALRPAAPVARRRRRSA